MFDDTMNIFMGFNWFIHETKKGTLLLEHSGGSGGSRSSLQFLPELNSGFVILTNSLANRNILEKEIAELLDKK
ncbi:serine hydrolase [Flavobacterium sp. LS1R49]|uniref:Serine hydrolase n=2 Tax=Flavobacterium shii TaxID=2987687 RepID=A0A9X3C5Z7_9FLAO|nr:serine hydrolase [Flavobacterium shii]